MERSEPAKTPESADAASAARSPLGKRAATASLWTLGSVTSMSLLRLGSQFVLAHLLVPQHFGVIAILRTFLIGIEQMSQVGFRNSIVYHERGEEPAFADTAWTVQILRGIGLWLLACVIAKPVAAFYGASNPDASILIWLLPFAALESVNNGFQSIYLFVLERRLKLRWPVVLEWIALAVSVTVTLTWAWFRPSVWALAAGPVAGGFVSMLLSFVVLPRRPRLCWDKAAVRDLFGFGKWVYLGTITAFVAQQFHVLFLGRVATLAVIGVYQLAWNFVLQSTKPLTMLANKVMIPFFAEYGRQARNLHSGSVRRALDRFLPACLLICTGAFVFSPALFGFFYPSAYGDGGRMGRLLAVVVWFMILQQVPRSALLSVGVSRGVFWLTLFNAAVTVTAVLIGFRLDGVDGVIFGNALGNVAGCFVGAMESRSHGIRIGLAMLAYTLVFIGVSLIGYMTMLVLQTPLVDLSERMASLVATCALCVPILLVLWRRVLRIAPTGGAPARERGFVA